MTSTATTVIWAGPPRRALSDALLHRRAAVVDRAPTCSCGQALERCRFAHCPRCGVTRQV